LLDPSLTCPHCGSEYVFRSHRWAIERPFLYLFHSIPYRCGSCLRRFHRRQKENNSPVSSAASSACPPRVPPNHLEETFSLMPPAHAEGPLGPGVSNASVPGPTGVQAAGRSAASAGIPREEAATWRGRRLKERHVSHGWHNRRSLLARYWRDVAYSFRHNRLGPYFKRYWGDVSFSFRSDLRTFYSVCRRFLAR
jgi:hypothetical protein